MASVNELTIERLLVALEGAANALDAAVDVIEYDAMRGETRAAEIVASRTVREVRALLRDALQ